MVGSVIRVHGGEIRGRKLRGPKGLLFRPATGRVKEFIFSYLGDLVEGASLLDLFSGSGALGIEALSRGAKDIFFVESSYHVLNIVRSNLKICGYLERAQWVCGDVFRETNRLAEQKKQFDLILADPPFKSHYRGRIVDAIEKNGLLKSGGLLIIEHVFNDPDSERHRFSLIKQKQFGHCMVSVYR